MDMIKTQCSTGIVREAALMWQIDFPTLGMTHRNAPPSVTGTGSKSAVSTLAVSKLGSNPSFGPVVVTDARVRDAGQAAPPRGTLC